MLKLISIYYIVVVMLCCFVFMTTCSYAFEVNLTTCGTLDQADTTYILQNDVTSTGSCFLITASNVTLDLNTKTVTYDNSVPIAVDNGSFESTLLGSWDITGAASANRVAGTFVDPVTLYDGLYSLKVTTPTADQTVVSVGTVTLAANTRYSLSAMVYNRVSDSISMSVEFNGTIKAIQMGKTNRGFQYISKEFVTGDIANTYNITLRVAGAGAVTAGEVYFDDIKIQRNRLVGIMVGPINWRDPPICSDATSYGTAINAVVKNGSVLQGTGNSDWSPAIANEANSTSGHEFSGLTLTTRGANSQAIGLHSLLNGNIHHNTLSANMSSITSRDNMNGAVMTGHGYNSKIHDNIISNGIQIGIAANSNAGQNPQDIYSNVIALQTRYTNDFAISAEGSLVHNNTVNCASGNSCRGILVGVNSKVYANTIDVQNLKNNQEYGGCPLGGTYGIQMQKASNTEIYGNMVTAIADECDASALRLNPEEGVGNTSSNNLIHDNTFTASAVGPASATSLRLSGIKNSEATIYNNTFITNRRWIYALYDGLIDSLTLASNKWETADILDSPFYPFKNYNWEGSYVKDMTFINNIYGSIADKSSFESEYFRLSSNMNIAEPNSSFLISWLLTLNTINQSSQLVSGVSVQITDVNGLQVYSGNSDNLSPLSIPLTEFKNVAGTKTYYTPFTITATRLNQTFSNTINMDSPKSLSFIFDTIPPQITATPDSGTFNTAQSVSIVSNETATIYYTLDGTEPTSLSNKYTGPVTIPSTKTLRFFGRDLAGNDSSVQSILYVIDISPPDVTINQVTSPTNLVFQTLSGTVSDNVGVSSVTVKVGETAPVAATVTGVNWTYIITNLSIGNNYATVTAIDVAGNISTKIATIVVDTTLPVINVFTVPVTSTNLIVAGIILTATDNIGITGYLINESSTPPAATAVNLASSPTSYVASTAGSKTLYAWVRDAAGNVSLSENGSVIIDMTPPTVTLNPVTSPTILTSQDLAGTINDNFPGVSVTVNVGMTAPVAATVNGANWTFTVTDLLVGNNSITVTATDAAGNSVIAPTAGITRVHAGSANSDGTITINDALKSLNYVLGYEIPTPEQFVRSDVAPVSMTTHQPQPDGKLNIDDIIVMLRRAVGMSW